MSDTSDTSPDESTLSQHPDVRLEVTELGPIERAGIDLRPLTIFIGPSNTGKTYLAILIYAIHRILMGFHRFPFWDDPFYQWLEQSRSSEADVRNLFLKSNQPQRTLRFSDLPDSMKKQMQTVFKNPSFLPDELGTELERCFNLDSIGRLIRNLSETDSYQSYVLKKSQIVVSISENSTELWSWKSNIWTDSGLEESSVSTDGQIEHIEMTLDRPKENSILAEKLKNLLNQRMHGTDKKYKLYRELSDIFRGGDTRQPAIYYLPAARSGIIQSHRIIASAMVSRATRTRLKRFEIPTLSGVEADFIEQLIRYDLTDMSYRRLLFQSTSKNPIADIAHRMETHTIGGEIVTRAPMGSGYPEFFYCPFGGVELPLSLASSMVSELAPVILFLRNNLCRGDMLIFEEPEAHLHPGAQTQIATILAQLVRAGVAVIVTTHSDWLLNVFSNLMLQGELVKRSGESRKDESLQSTLNPDDVGVWFFGNPDKNSGTIVKESRFDWRNGIEVSDYEDIAQSLYNEFAGLQNRLGIGDE